MKRGLPAMARAFLAATPAPCLDESAVARGLAAALEADREQSALDLHTRRVEVAAAPVFARALRELGVSREEIASKSRERRVTGRRKTVIRWLLGAGLNVSTVAGLVGRDRKYVRAVSAAEGGLMDTVAAVEQRMAAHG